MTLPLRKRYDGSHANLLVIDVHRYSLGPDQERECKILLHMPLYYFTDSIRNGLRTDEGIDRA
jgi:hypothetical protein